ncbi:MAG: choice-of-anchor D domain-containing protein, partial [Candidatus Ratteibacteria bacterium]
MNIMIKKYLLTILSIPVLSILLSIQYCNAYVSWASTNQNQYPGAADAVFKDLGPNAWGIPVSFQVGHAAIFYQYGTDGSRQVIQANGYSAPSSIASWSDFLGGLEYWGAYSQSRIDASAREEILYIATTYCLNIPYALNRGHYKDPPNSLRCDGLVEYCYERAFGEENSPAYTQPNQGIVPNDQYDGNALRLWSFALDSDSSEHYMTPEIVMEWINNQSTVDDPTTDDHDWGSGNSRQGKNSINHNPALTSGTVSPSSGYANSTSFTYSVSYSDADLDVPVTAYVYIDGNPHTMTFVSGKAYNGIYQYITTLSSGSHSYYFYFIDNQNKSGSCRLPSSGNYSGPIITIPPAISVSPSDGLTSSGNQGGPFSPSSKQYSVSNSGGGTLNWTASANQNWVTVSPTSGTNSGTATVSINSNANSLSGGATYIATVTFGGNGGSTARQVSLTVQNQTAIINMTIGPLPVDFGTVSVGQSVQQNLTITNGSNSTGALIGSVGTPPVPFSLVSDNAFNLAPGQSKIFTFRFSPTTNDTFNNSFAVTSNATNQVSPVNLSMCGVGFGGPSYGMTITSCAISNTNPNTGQAVTLTGMGGQVHGVTSGDLIKVVVGFRDGSGNWRGGEPVLVSSTVPGQSFQPWSYSSGVSVNAPSSSGTYYVWVRSVPTVTNATAIQDFKNAAPTSADQQRDDKWSTPLTVNGNDPLFGNLLLYKQDGTQILGNVPIDNPVR